MKQEWEGKDRMLCGKPLFAASNSGKGFMSYYDDVFGGERIERRYIIKGGPGTGKSSFLSRVAEAAESRGLGVEYYRCSSDPDSLDGIVLDGRIALVDGTPPHTVEAVLPGVRDEIVNLGVFWDAEALGKRRTEIGRLFEEKSRCYRRAYRFLAACDDLYLVNRECILTAVKQEKLERAAERMLGRIPNGQGFSLMPSPISSVGIRGRVRFDSFERAARARYVVEDHYETGALFLRALIVGGMKKECAMRVSYHPVHVGEPDAVLFTDSGIGFFIGKPDGSEDGVISMKRFADAEAVRAVRGKLRMNRRLYDSLLESACDALREAGDFHAAVEQIYGSCMDFHALEEFTHEFCQGLL